MIFELIQQNKIQDEMEYYECKKEETMKKVVERTFHIYQRMNNWMLSV